ncbi:DUF1049 domain-containing protein [Sphingosinicella microcystinivorans]|uniref:Uncharacterized protein DUF1049 n=1 Tax=Sphingosinicella microcystinivorans TaxID=335406 RepID=A0AAD1D5L3_SPHMI|nr:DUF1049 domain-containing protein [Sphingosinicella microcystinivorans]RKS90896.1 uncharacterized protein DUF1049 [Sphingosinicella microcystinivorans]BBE33812.1 hypothetical protein SmB9_14700 [Sphingosinicella microcystinivorans]
MRIVTLIFYFLFGALLAWFAARNWDFVTLKLWGDYELAIRLPVLLLLMFLAGALPLAILRYASRWRWSRRVQKLERALEDTQPPLAPTATLTDPAPPPPIAPL